MITNVVYNSFSKKMNVYRTIFSNELFNINWIMQYNSLMSFVKKINKIHWCLLRSIGPVRCTHPNFIIIFEFFYYLLLIPNSFHHMLCELQWAPSCIVSSPFFYILLWDINFYFFGFKSFINFLWILESI